MSKKQLIILISALVVLLIFTLLNIFITQEKTDESFIKNSEEEIAAEISNQFQSSCIEQGTWLGGQNNECEIEGDIYPNGSWIRIAEMKESCLEYGGEFYSGPKFMCKINDEFYYDKNWIRASIIPNMATMCEADGGIWLEEYKECEGLSIDWCINAEMSFEEIKGLTFNECASACRHNLEAEMCTMQCVPVCTLNL